MEETRAGLALILAKLSASLAFPSNPEVLAHKSISVAMVHFHMAL